MDVNADYFKTFHYPVGMVRITVEKAWGFGEEAQSTTRKLFNKLTRAAPDCYTIVSVGAEEPWQTTTRPRLDSPPADGHVGRSDFRVWPAHTSEEELAGSS